MKMNEAAKLRILYFLAFSCTAAWQPIFADYLNSRGITDFRMGLILAVTPLLMFVVQPFYGMLADRYGYKKIPYFLHYWPPLALRCFFSTEDLFT